VQAEVHIGGRKALGDSSFVHQGDSAARFESRGECR
jgi:hypothetical protein